MTHTTEQLNELIEITRDGQRFYQHAHDEVKDTRLQALFRDMSQSKGELIRALSVKVDMGPVDGMGYRRHPLNIQRYELPCIGSNFTTH